MCEKSSGYRGKANERMFLGKEGGKRSRVILRMTSAHFLVLICPFSECLNALKTENLSYLSAQESTTS